LVELLVVNLAAQRAVPLVALWVAHLVVMKVVVTAEQKVAERVALSVDHWAGYLAARRVVYLAACLAEPSVDSMAEMLAFE